MAWALKDILDPFEPGLCSLLEIFSTGQCKDSSIKRLEPYKYLRYLFEKLPFAMSEEDSGRLLPQSLCLADLDLGQIVTGV